MSGYVPERSLAYPASHLCFEIPSAVYKAVLAATEQAESAGAPTDWMQLYNTGPTGRVIEFSGTHILPLVDSSLQASPFARTSAQNGASRPTLLGNFRSLLSDREWTYDPDMVVDARMVRSRRSLGSLIGRKAVFLTAWNAPFVEPFKDEFNSRRPEY